jgi:hypothetical protein
VEIIQNSIYDFSEGDHNFEEEDNDFDNYEEEYGDENNNMNINEDRKGFVDHCQLINLILKYQLRNETKVQSF